MELDIPETPIVNNYSPTYEDRSTRGFCAIGIFHGKTWQNVGSLWRSAQQFNCNFIFTIGERYSHQRTDVAKVPRHIPLFNYKDFQDFLDHKPSNSEVVGIELCDRAIPLEKFQPYPRTLYLLGGEDVGLSPEVIKTCRKVVKLPGKVSMNVSCAGSIVLWNHFVKTA